ncbi:lipid A export permease/ATP-binding protein MsbA [Thalassotalea atypica]|uniref:lipid A export permease/ATP-binding protein MsbA n=1 Tax=Thalassotalea atypica TaxID=2054316 RepID=UPI00257372D1|nr:lipid A export permease/ATP-binding protein MsbA [Thalassotalea atypica]
MQDKPQTSTWQNFIRLMQYAKPYKAGFIVAIIGMLGYAAVDSYFFSNLQPLLDDGLTGKNPNIMKWAPVFVIVLFILRGIFHFMGNYCLAWVGNNIVADIRQRLFEHIMAMPVKYHDKESTGTLISKLTFDTEQVLSATSKALLTLVQQGAFVTGLLIVMFYNSWKLSAIFLLIVPIIAVIVTFVSKRFRMVSKKIQDSMGVVTSAAEQTFNGHKVVLTFGGQQRESERFGKINKHNRQQRMKMVATKASSVPIIQIIASFALAFVLYIANLESMKESLTPGIFTTVLSCMVMLLRPLKLLTTVNSEFQRGMAACASIFKVLDAEKEKDLGTTALEKSRGVLELKDVDFGYDGEEQLALKKLSFKADAGQTIALVGRSGSGKSTTISLLLRFYQANAGKVLVDGEDINSYKLADIRKQFAFVSQQVVLFNDSIANNIAYGKPDASREEINAAARSAHVIEFADNMPDGLDTNIGENGAMLSGGQRQRVAIARALLCDAPFLILDEATSALDTESERHIQDALQVLQQNRTSIVIAHRLSTIEKADQILVMEQGEVIEQGKHGELLAKEGAYAQLHSFQFGQ